MKNLLFIIFITFVTLSHASAVECSIGKEIYEDGETKYRILKETIMIPDAHDNDTLSFVDETTVTSSLGSTIRYFQSNKVSVTVHFSITQKTSAGISTSIVSTIAEKSKSSVVQSWVDHSGAVYSSRLSGGSIHLQTGEELGIPTYIFKCKF